MNVVTHLGKVDLRRLLERYAVGELVHHWPAAHGIENSNYFLRTRLDGAGREWVLTVLEQASYAGGVLVPLLDLCHISGLPVAPIVRNAAGSAHETLNGKTVLLTPRLPGEHPLTPTSAQVKTLGSAIAKLHLATRHPTFATPPYPRDEAWLRREVESARQHFRRTANRPADTNDGLPPGVWAASAQAQSDGAKAPGLGKAGTALPRGHHALRPEGPSPGQSPPASESDADVLLLDALLGNATETLRQAEASRLPKGVIHGDLFRDNVLFEGDGLTGLLDFHHAAVGYLIYDLAVAANDWCSLPDGRLNASQANALLAAYHRIRPLTDTELAAFPDFMAYAALAFWLSRLSAASKAQSGLPVRVKDPDEFRRIGADRARRGFRPRLWELAR